MKGCEKLIYKERVRGLHAEKGEGKRERNDYVVAYRTPHLKFSALDGKCRREEEAGEEYEAVDGRDGEDAHLVGDLLAESRGIEKRYRKRRREIADCGERRE